MLSPEGKKIFYHTIVVIQIFIPICGIILHVFLLYAFYKDPLKCLKKLRTAFVINLAVSDFLFCSVMLLQASISAPVGIKETSFLLANISIFGNVSCLTVASISVDRLLLIVYPIKHRYWVRKKLIAVWISLIWFVSVSYSLKRSILGVEKKYEDLLYGGLIFGLFSLTSLVYASVYIALKKKLKNRTELNEGNELRDRAKDVSLLKEKKFLKTIIFIASITFLSYGPGWILWHMYPSITIQESLGSLMFLTAYSLLFLTNFAINPLIYIFRFPNYGKTFQVLYCRK